MITKSDLYRLPNLCYVIYEIRLLKCEIDLTKYY